MALEGYGVLKGWAVDRRRGTASNPHYQVHVVDDTTDYRIAVNVKSAQAPSEVLYLFRERFEHPITAVLADKPAGFSALASAPGSGALDFIRLNLFQRADFVPLPPETAGPGNDLNDRMDALLEPVLNSDDILVYALGQRWGPEDGKKDKVFGFAPGNGIHDIHMNQGNAGQFTKDNGVWQDGGLLVSYPDGHWSAVFLGFQSQAWHTDDQTGDAIGPPAPVGAAQPTTPTTPTTPTSPEPAPTGDAELVIVGALVNPVGPAPEVETVTLLNTTPHAVDVGGWQLANLAKDKGTIAGVIPPGGTLAVRSPVALSNQGGIITLLDPAGLKIHGVSYTKDQARREGWTLTF